MALAFEKLAEFENPPRFASTLEPFECEIIIQAVTEIIALLTKEAVAEASVDPAKSGESEGDSAIDPLFEQLGLAGVFADPDTVASATPVEPATARLFPPGYVGDQAAANDFKRFTEVELRQGKIAAAQLILQSLKLALGRSPCSVQISQSEVGTWLTGINDLRLVVAVQIGVGQPDEPERRAHPDHEGASGLYDFLTWWQDSLLQALQ